MEYKFNAVKEQRKVLVAAISEIMNLDSKYLRAPSLAYSVGSCIISVNGTVSFEVAPDEWVLNDLLTQLEERGFVYERDESLSEQGNSITEDESVGIVENNFDAEVNTSGVIEDAEVESVANTEPTTVSADEALTDNPNNNRLAIYMRLSDFTSTALSNLEKMITAKAWILKKMTGAEELPIERVDDKIGFPWFKPEPKPNELDAYTYLVSLLCLTAKEKQRISAVERLPQPGENEKYKARCFLLSLGFIGSDYSQARKILLAPMAGSGAFLQGGHRERRNGAEISTDVAVEEKE